MLQSAAGQASKIYISDPLWHTVAPLRDILAGALLPQNIGVRRDPRPISSLGALDGGSDRDRFVSVVCRLSVCLSSGCPPPATHPRPTPTNGSIHGSIQDRSRIDPGFYNILHDFTYFYTKVDKIHILARIFAPARHTHRRK